MSDMLFKNDINEILKWIPPESHTRVKQIWEENKKLGMIYITQYMPFMTIYMTVSWCYSKAGIDSLPIYSQNESSFTAIHNGFPLMAINHIFGDSPKYANFVDKYVKNKIKNLLKDNGLFYDFEIDEFFKYEPEISIIEDESGKMAIIRLSKNGVVFVFRTGYRFTWIPDSMPLNFEAVKWTLNENFSCVRDAEKYNILEGV